MFVVAVVSASGGVGKTSITATLASLVAKRDWPVVAWDLDPQNSLGLHLGADSTERGWVSAQLAGGSAADALLQNTDNVLMLPFGVTTKRDLGNLWHAIKRPNFELTQSLQGLRLPDRGIVLLDTPPVFLEITQQAIAAADLVIGVIRSDAASLMGVRTLETAFRHPRPKEEFRRAYLLNNVDVTRRLQGDMVLVMREQLSHHLIPHLIHADAAVPEAFAKGRPTEFGEHSQAAYDFGCLASWLLEAAGNSGVAAIA